MKKENSKSYLINSLIGITIMIFFRYLPIELPGITEIGMQVIGIFIGTLYLWTTVDPLWSSLLSVCMLAFSDYAAAGTVLSSFLGNGTAMQMFFLMLFTAALTHYKITPYLVRVFLKLKITHNRPWVLTFVIISGSYIIASFIDPLSATLLFWAIMYDVFKEVGFKKEDLYVKLSLILIGIMSLIGSGVAPYRAPRIAMFQAYAAMSDGVLVPDAQYLLFAFVLGFVLLAVFILVCKFIFRVDVTPLEGFKIEKLDVNPLPKMSLHQKVISISFFLLIVLMLLPSMFSNVAFLSVISSNSIALPMFIVTVLCAIRIDGEPGFAFKEIIATKFNWSIYFLSCVALLYGTALTSEAVGTEAFLDVVLTPAMSGVSSTLFLVLLLVIAGLLTNVINNSVIQLLFLPVILTYTVANAAVNPIVAVALLSFVASGTAFMTPAASPYSALIFGNTEWLSSKDVYKYGVIFALISLVSMIVIGIPWANFCFSL